jgi:hypothetical protein
MVLLLDVDIAIEFHKHVGRHDTDQQNKSSNCRRYRHCQHQDEGCPTVFGAPDGELSQTYLKLARRVGAELYFSAKPIATPLYTVALDE